MGESRALILNAWPPGSQYGHAAGLREALARIGHRDVAAVDIHGTTSRPSLDFVHRASTLVTSQSWSDVYVLGAPDVSLLRPRERAELQSALQSARVLYWESDAWGRGKPVAPGVRFWLRTANTVVHAGGLKSIRRHTSSKTRIRFAPPCYCHLTFAAAERCAPAPTASGHAVMIANNVTKTQIPIPGMTGIADGFGRWLVASQLSRQLGRARFHLYGKNWPTKWSRGPIPFSKQVTIMRDAAAVAIWDHFQSRADYASNRLPIALLSGRPVFSSPVRKASWLPNNLSGLTFSSSTAELVSSIEDALSRAASNGEEPSHANWEWVRYRLSTARLGEFFVEQMYPGAYPDLPFPWSPHDRSTQPRN